MGRLMREQAEGAQSLSILVVDDDEDCVLIIRDLLNDIPRFDCSVDWAPDFDAAWPKLRDGQFDLCLVDNRVGAHTGTDFIHAATRDMLDVPMVLLTGFCDSPVDVEASRAGAVDFLCKDGLSSEILGRSIHFALSNWEKTSALRKRQSQLEEANRALSEQKTLLQLSLDHTKHGIAMFDAENRLIACNRRYLDIYGFSPDIVRPGIGIEEIINYSVQLGNYSKAEAERVLAERRVQIDSPAPSTYHQCLANNRTIAVNHVPVVGKRSVTTCEDITDALMREQTSAKLARDAALADAATVAKSKFLSNMSHELRTPLNAIMGFSDVIRVQEGEAFGEDESREYAELIYQSAQELLRTVDRTLEMSLLLNEELDMHEAAFSAGDMVSTVLDSYRQRAAEKNLTLRSAEAPPDLQILGDRDRIAQALENIVDNAVKFCLPDGIIAVSQKITDQRDWVVSVSNTGSGIDPEDQDVIFTPFGQLEGPERRQHHGAGLGLPIALGLVRLHGGDIEIDGQCDLGTTVSIKLPAERVIFGEGGNSAGDRDAEQLPEADGGQAAEPRRNAL